MRIRFIAAILFYCSCAAAQVKQPVYKIAPALTEQYITIPCEFGKAALAIPGNMIDLTTVQVTAVDLVFTDFPSANSLRKLTLTRLQNLWAAFPFLISIPGNMIRQTGGAERNAAMKMFHGFVIYYKPLQSKATITTDLIKLKELLKPEGTAVKRNGFVTGDTTELRKKYEIEEYTTVLKLPVAEALHLLDIEKERSFYKDYDSLFIYLKPRADTAAATTMKPPVDSTVLKVFNRMHWNNMLVVADVTASMYPYTGQLLYWLKQHEDERRIKRFVFFNDGDDKDDVQKIIGNTGGVYNTSSSVYEVVEQLVFKAMSNGNGGNIPENNIEALLKGSAFCPECSETVMIADNSSPVSDMSLLLQLRHPVHIILCGVHELINTDYLDIAKSTGGSVHIADEDVQLSNVKDGEELIIKGKKYKLSNGRFTTEIH
jgi:hypothetical protein